MSGGNGLGFLADAVFLAEAPQHSHPTWADFTATTWIAVVLVGLATMWAVWKAVMYTIHPGEQDPDHIKRLILGEPEALQVDVVSADGLVSAQSAGTAAVSGSGGPAPDERPAGDDTAELKDE